MTRIKNLEVVNGNQESLSQQMMDEIRKIILDKKYDHITIATLVGVLEMIKWEHMERTTQ